MMGPAPLRRILGVRLTCADPQTLARFYVEAIGFNAAAPTPISAEEMAMLGLAGSGRRIRLSLGDVWLDLDGFSEPGRPYPSDSDAADLVFQHCAIVVTDAEAAFQRAQGNGAGAISRGGAVLLPPSAGGVTAAKFRDPEGHPLEFLQFPPNAPSPWSKAPKNGYGAQGLDHSAISVADVDASVAFYQAHGLRAQHRTLNHGKTQAALDGLVAPKVDVVPLASQIRTPHLELLGYRSPRGRPPPPSRPNDIAKTRIVWLSDRKGLMADPDGHLHQLDQPH